MIDRCRYHLDASRAFLAFIADRTADNLLAIETALESQDWAAFQDDVQNRVGISVTGDELLRQHADSHLARSNEAREAATGHPVS